MGTMEFLSTTEFTIPLVQVVSYVFLSTLFFLFKNYKWGLMVSYAFVFNWGYLHGSTNFVDAMGKPTMGSTVYLISGLTMAVLVLVGFFREE